MRPRVYLPLLLAFASVALPQIALAALVPLVPCGITDPTSCQFCDIAKLVQNIINFSIQLSIPIAIVLFSFAGVSYATAGGNPGKIQAATKIFSRVAVGFLLVLSSWLIINTILAVLLGGSLYGNGKWFTIPCVARTAGSNTVSNLLSGLVSGQTGLSQTSGSGQGGVAVVPAVADLSTIKAPTSYQPGGGGDNGGDAFAYGPGKPYTVQDCLNEIAKGSTSCSKSVVVAATPDNGVADQLKGTTFTWDPISAGYGLPAGTTYIVCDKYASGYGHGTFDVAVCHGGQTCTNSPSTAPALQTQPVQTGTGNCSTAGIK